MQCLILLWLELCRSGAGGNVMERLMRDVLAESQ